jgi:hypothetical protein
MDGDAPYPEKNAPFLTGKDGNVGVAGAGSEGSEGVEGDTTFANGRLPLSGTASGSHVLVVGLKVYGFPSITHLLFSPSS